MMEKILQLDVLYAHSFVQFMVPLLIKICNTSKISRIRACRSTASSAFA